MTVEETFKEFFDSFPRYGSSLAKNWEKEIMELAKKHTKYYVQKALEAAADNVKTKEISNGSIGFLVKNTTKSIVDKESILNAYPLTNIK